LFFHYNKKKFVFKKNYKLHIKKKIIINSIFKKKFNNTFLRRFLFSIRVSLLLKNKKSIILTRSLISSFFMSIFNIDHFLEIHQEIKGITKLLIIDLDYINSKNVIKVIFISQGLANFYSSKKTNNIVLHDACELRDFIKKKPSKYVKNIYYVGSFYKGRGIELIEQIASKMPDLNFFAYGMRNEKKKSTKNLKFFKIISYSKVGEVLKKADLLLMPYQSKISINSQNYNDEISKFISPLKMFEYFATGVPIISSNLKVLREKLIHNRNCLLVNDFDNPNNWIKLIKKLKKNFNLRKKIFHGAIQVAKKNTWRIRVNKIMKIYEKFYMK